MTTCHSVDHVMLNFELDEVRWTLNWALARWTGQSDLGHFGQIDFSGNEKKIEKKWEKIRRPQRNFLTFATSNDERSMCTPGTQHFLSGRREIATCPARKNGRRKEDEKVKKYQSEKGKKNLQANV